MTFDTNTILIIVAVLAALIVLFLLVRPKPRIEHKPRQEGYVADTTRPYVAKKEPDGPQGNAITDEMASAATDVTGQVLGVEVHGELPGASGPPDDLTRLKGVGPKFAARLNELGVIRYDQLAGLSATEIAMLDDRLGPFKGRLARDRVPEQAAFLARGDTDGFEATFGKLG